MQTSSFFSSAQQQSLFLIHDRLCIEYGCPIAYFHNLDPLSELVASLLSHRTKNKDSHRAFQQLIERFPSWEYSKAPRLQQVLRLIGERLDENWSLDFLGEMSVAEARAWLESLPGVGPKTSAAVLAFSRLRSRALPVDSHHHRVAVRLGILPPKVDVGSSHSILEAMLPADWTAQQVYDHHEVLMLHGQKCCYYRNPACDRCPLFDLCPSKRVDC